MTRGNGKVAGMNELSSLLVGGFILAVVCMLIIEHRLSRIQRAAEIMAGLRKK